MDNPISRRAILLGGSIALFIPPAGRATAADANVLAGAKWYFYAAGTAIPKEVYTTSDRNVAHPSPVVADGGGLFPPIYLDPSVTYRAVLKTSAGATVQDIDSYDGGAGGAAAPKGVVTPYMFGADEKAADNSAALNAFFDHINKNNVKADMNGVFDVRSAVTMGGAYGEAGGSERKTSVISGRLTLNVTAAIPGAVVINNLHGGVTLGQICVTCNDLMDWNGRLFDIGILFQDKAQLQKWQGGSVGYARLAGIMVQTGHGPGTDNTFANELGSWFFYGCGSGSNMATPEAFKSTSYSAFRNNGAAGDLNQSATLRVAAQPPAIATDGDFEVPLYIVIEDEVYAVTARDAGAGTVTLHAWLNSRAAASGTAYYLFGAGALLVGSDAGLQRGNFVSTSCAIGCLNGALYPGEVNVTAQECAIGYQAGASLGAAMVGGSVTGYFENNIVDLLWGAVQEAHGHTLRSEHALSLSKIWWHRPRLTDGSLARIGMPGRFNVNFNGAWHHRENVPEADGTAQRVRLALNRPCGEIVPLHSNDPIIVIESGNIDNVTDYKSYNSLFGYRGRLVLVTGSGGAKQPTGTLLVGVDVRAHKINGGAAGANATFTGFTGPALILIELDPADNLNWLVSIVSGRALHGSAVWNPASVAPAAAVSTAVRVIGAALGDAAVASFSRSTAGLILSAAVTAAHTVTVTLFNPTRSAIDLPAGTVTARLVQ